jgi:hypothetical protein
MRNRQQSKAKPAPVSPRVFNGEKLGIAVSAALAVANDRNITAPTFPITPPALAPGVVPKGVTAPVMAMDYAPYSAQLAAYINAGFPGFPYLAQLATRAEYRSFASTMATEVTREWIEFTSQKTTEGKDEATGQKLKDLEVLFINLKVRETIATCVQHDCFFGRSQIFLKIDGADPQDPLILAPQTIRKGSFKSVSAVEPIWTTPMAYNTLDPSAPDFYRPSSWYMLAQEVHASRLLPIITRPLPDILKPAYNFAGMSLSQLAQPYVDNWLTTRQSVADLIRNFSITTLASNLSALLQGDIDGAAGDVIKRAQLFTATRNNLGLMLLDKDSEEMGQINTPLSGLHELQAQAQEFMSTVSRIPSVILTGSSPGGLNASSEGEIRVFYDWISAQQEAFWRPAIDIIFKVAQLSLFGAIDPDIGFKFVPLYQMTPKELAEIRKADSETANTYVGMGAIAPEEVRDKLAKDPISGYDGIDTTVTPPDLADADDDTDPDDADDTGAQDSEFLEQDHPRDDDGKFSSGGSSRSLSDQDRNNIARSSELFDKYGRKEEGGRGEFKEAARSGKLDHLWEEYQGVVESRRQAAKENKDAKNKEWREKNMPKLIAAKERRIDAERAEKEVRREAYKSYQSAASSTEKTYLNVPYSDKDAAKAAGAKWDSEKKKWFYPALEIPDKLKRFVPPASPAPSRPTASAPSQRQSWIPTSGRVDSDDPSIYGSWLLGHEGESWASVAHLALGRMAKDELTVEQIADLNENYSD